MDAGTATPLRKYIQQHPDALFLLDSLGSFTSVSESFARLVGVEPATLLTYSLGQLLSPTNPGAADLIREHSQRGEVLTLEVTMPSTAGPPAGLELTTIPSLSDGKIASIQGQARLKGASELSRKSLEQREQQLSVIFSSVADVIFVLQVEAEAAYRFVFINKAFETVTGLPIASVVGKLVQEIIPEPSYSLVLAKYRQAAETKQLVSWLELTVYPTGTLVGQVSVTPVFDDRGHCIQLVGTVHDLTAQKRVEEDLQLSNERFAYALKATTDALYDWNIESEKLVLGEGFTTLFGYDVVADPLSFQQWAACLHPEEAAAVLHDLQYTTSATQAAIWQHEYRFRRADGTWANVYDRGCIIRDADGTAIRMIGAMQDITERKEAEAQQRLLLQELNRQNANLQQFTYIVSHNLRAPLANALGFASLLARVEKGSDVFATSLRHLHTSLTQLDSIISDVNSILSIRDQTEAGHPEPVSLSSVCSKVIDTLTPALTECGGTLTCAIPETVRVTGYRAYFNSIFFNLLTNAIKYRSSERPLQIAVRARSDQEHGVTITVEDNGSGINLKQAGGDLFQLYKRFHTAPAGRGMGLYLVKSHVEAMGGQIEVSSQANQGTCFTLSFS